MISVMIHIVVHVLMMMVGIIRVTFIRGRAVLVHIAVMVMGVVVMVLEAANHRAHIVSSLHQIEFIGIPIAHHIHRVLLQTHIIQKRINVLLHLRLLPLLRPHSHRAHKIVASVRPEMRRLNAAHVHHSRNRLQNGIPQIGAILGSVVEQDLRRMLRHNSNRKA